LIVYVHQAILKQSNNSATQQKNNNNENTSTAVVPSEPLIDKIKEYLKKAIDLSALWLR